MNRKGERTVILGTRRSTAATRGRGNVKEGGRESPSPPGETKEGSPRWSGLGREVGGGGLQSCLEHYFLNDLVEYR